MNTTTKIYSDCGEDCTLCNGLISVIVEEGLSLQEVKSNRQPIVDKYLEKFGYPSADSPIAKETIGGDLMTQSCWVMEIRSALADLREE